MRINKEHNTMDMEARDINYILPAYLRSYRYYMGNADPKEIVFPMFQSVLSQTGAVIPIRWVAAESEVAQEIAEDGKNIPEVAEEEGATGPPADEPVEVEPQAIPTETAEGQEGAPPPGWDANEDLKAGKAMLDEEASKQGVVVEDRQPKMPPGGDLGGGHPDGMGGRDTRLDMQVARDVRPDAQVDESKELDTDIKKETQ